MTLDELIGHVERADKANIIAGGLQNPKLQAEADKQKKALAINYLTNVIGRFEDEDDFKARIPNENDRKDIINSAFEVIHQTSYEDALVAFQSNPDAVFKDGKEYRPSLLKLVADENAVSHAVKYLAKKDKKLAPLAALYHVQEQSKDLVDRIEKGKEIDEKEREQLVQEAVNANVVRVYGALKKKGRTDNYAKAGAALEKVITNAEIKTDRKILKKGVEAKIEKIKKEMEKINPNYEQLVAEGLGDYLVALSKSSGAEKNGQPIAYRVVDSLYQLEKGYGVGQREFNDVFKKK